MGIRLKTQQPSEWRVPLGFAEGRLLQITSGNGYGYIHMKTKIKSYGTIHTLLCLLSATFFVQAVSAETQFTNEFWISTSTNTANLGTLDNPYDGSTQAKFDGVMAGLPPNTTIHILAGTYQTIGQNNWSIQSGQKILGSGIDNTIVKLVPNNGNGWYVYVMSGLSGLVYSNIVVADLTLDASYTSVYNVSFNGVGLSGTYNTVRNVKVINTGGSQAIESFAITLGNCGNLGVSEGNLVENCEIGPVFGTYGDGVAFNGGPANWVSGIIRNNHIIGASLGINGAWMRDTLVEGNYVQG